MSDDVREVDELISKIQEKISEGQAQQQHFENLLDSGMLPNHALKRVKSKDWQPLITRVQHQHGSEAANRISKMITGLEVDQDRYGRGSHKYRMARIETNKQIRAYLRSLQK